MRTHHFKRLCPCHAGETARKGDSAFERRTVHFSNGHHAPVAAANHLSSCLLLSRPASARTGCWSLLLLRIDTGTKRFHQIHHARRSSFPSGFDLLASLFLLQEIDERVFIAILELRRIEVTRFRLHDVGSQVEHLLRELKLGDVLEIWFLVANFIRVAECGAYEAASLRFKGDYVLAPRQHDPAERNHIQLRNGVADDGKSLLTNRAIRGNVVRRVDITLIDLIFWNELVNIDGARAFDQDGLYFLILNNHVLALCDLIAAHHVVPRDDLAGLRIDILLLQSVARFPVDPIETHFFAERGGRIERNGARDQRKPKIALPVRTRRHWILLNNTRRANYIANFSKCLRPLSGVREPRARSSASRGPGDAPLQPMPGMRLARGCRTGRSWRGIVLFTHLAREGRMTVTIGRRELLAALGGAAAAWPLPARAQSVMPVIGFLRPSTRESAVHLLAAFRAGLKELGFVEGQNVAIEYRWAERQEDRLREIAAELVRRQVAVIVTPGSTVAALAAKAETTTIPIVFSSGSDPVKAGLIASLNSPGGNVTGIYQLSNDLIGKRLELLHEVVPAVTTIALLVNPANAVAADSTTKEAQAAARSLGLEIKVFATSNNRDIDAAFIEIAHQQIGAVLNMPDAFFTSRRVQLVTLATRFAIPAIFSIREYVEVGGLMSYGENIADQWRRVGVYVGRVLKGEKNLPVEQAARFEFVINLQTARAFDLVIPSSLLAIADEVIE